MAAPARLPRRLGLAEAVVIGAGSMVGAGVFVAWSPAAAAAGTGLLLGLALAAVVASCNAASSAQLAAAHPESGGTYVFARHRLGPAWGHLAGWGFVVGKTASCVAIALAVGAYLWPERERWLAMALVVGVAVVNVGGLRRTAAVTVALLAVAVTSLAIVVVSGWTVPDTSLARLLPIDGDLFGIIRSGGFLFFAFAGYARIATLGEEVRDPERTIPRAIPIALGAVLVLYAVVGVTALTAVPVAALATTDAPLRLVVEAGGLDSLAPVTTVGAAIASAGVLLNLLPGISRTVLAMARRDELPRWFAHVDARRQLPLRAELSVVAIVIVLLVAADLRSAIALSGVTVLSYYAITNAAALRLGPDERRWPRPLAVVGLIGCVLLVAGLPPRAIVVGALTMLTGVLVRLVIGRRPTFTAPSPDGC
ncbi:MAG: APC family permease [Ilumatobacteraceae bacterium]